MIIFFHIVSSYVYLRLASSFLAGWIIFDTNSQVFIHENDSDNFLQWSKLMWFWFALLCFTLKLPCSHWYHFWTIPHSRSRKEMKTSVEVFYGKSLCIVFLCACADSSGDSVPDYRTDGSGFAPRTGRPRLGSPSFTGYWSITMSLNTAEKTTGHPTSPWRWPSIIGAITCPSATRT